MRFAERLAFRLAARLPIRLSASHYLTIQIRMRHVCGSAGYAVAYLVLVHEGQDDVRSLVRLPGSRLVELWSAQDDPWLSGGPNPWRRPKGGVGW